MAARYRITNPHSDGAAAIAALRYGTGRASVRRGWHICGVGPARFGLAAQVGQSLVWLGRSWEELESLVACGDLRLGRDGLPF